MLQDGDIPYFVNKRVMWMERKKQLSLSNTLSRLHHLQQATPSTPQQDRISELCDVLLHKILSFMPMQMSIQTSVLSKRWHHLWKYMHIVDFHTLPFSNTEPVDYTPINRCLDSLESPNIQSFTVVGHVGHHSNPDVRRWVEFALSKNVHTLRIGLMPISLSFSLLPSSLFSEKQTQKLKVLFLSHVDFTPPPEVTFSGSGFVSLRSLSFTNCKLADRTVELLLLNCLVLQVLVIDWCEGLLNVNIRGPNLKLKQLTFSWDIFDEEVDDEFLLLEVDAPGLSTLKYAGDLTKIRLKNCQGLEKIILIGVREKIDQAIADHIRELINQVTQVKILGVDSLFLQFRPVCGDPFCGWVWERIRKPKFVMVESTGYQLYHVRFLKKLESVRIICFSGYDGEMMLVRLLLEKAENLQKLELLWQSHPSDMIDNVLQIVIKDRSQKRYSGPGVFDQIVEHPWQLEGPKGTYGAKKVEEAKALYSLGYIKSGAHLEEESGISLHSSMVNVFTQQILEGYWDEGVATLHNIGLTYEMTIKPSSFLILEEKFFELLDEEKVMDALKTLRTEIEPLCINNSRCGRYQIPSQALQILQVHTDEVWFLQFSYNRKYLASSSNDQSEIIWEVDANGVSLKHKLSGHGKPISSVSWSPDDHEFLTCGVEEVVRCWDVSFGECLHVYEKAGLGMVFCEWSPDANGYFLV
ncbi:hypothetical protein CRYUN_Cryun19dG0142700 [Craigia yunnanensis]